MQKILTQYKPAIQDFLPPLVKKRIDAIGRFDGVDAVSVLWEWIREGMNTRWDFKNNKPKKRLR